MRLISLLIAIGLWLYVVYAENPELEFWVRGVAIEYANESKLAPNSLVVLTPIESSTVSVRVKGRRKNLSMLTAANVTARVNLGDIAQSGSYYLPVDIGFNIYGVEVIDKNPYNISVTVDDLVTAKRPVQIDFVGMPRENYSVSGHTKSLDSVDITGPLSVVGTITAGRAVVDINGLDSKKSFNLPIHLITDENREYMGDMLSISKTFVSVTTDVLLTKSLTITPQITNSDDIRVNVNIKPNTVILSGVPSALEGVEEVLTTPFAINPDDTNEIIVADLILPPDTVLTEDITSVQIEVVAESIVSP